MTELSDKIKVFLDSCVLVTNGPTGDIIVRLMDPNFEFSFVEVARTESGSLDKRAELIRLIINRIVEGAIDMHDCSTAICEKIHES